MNKEIKKRKYVAVWYNKATDKTCVEHILAEDISEAKLIMIYLMKYYGGNSYELKDIKHISEEISNYYVDYECILNKYRMNKKLIPYVAQILSNIGDNNEN